MIAALKRNLRSQESTRKEQLVPGKPGKDGKEECILTLVSKKIKNFPGRKWKKCILAKEMASNSVKKY